MLCFYWVTDSRPPLCTSEFMKAFLEVAASSGADRAGNGPINLTMPAQEKKELLSLKETKREQNRAAFVSLTQPKCTCRVAKTNSSYRQRWALSSSSGRDVNKQSWTLLIVTLLNFDIWIKRSFVEEDYIPNRRNKDELLQGVCLRCF